MKRLFAIASAALFAVSIAATATAQVPVDPAAGGDCPGPADPVSVDLLGGTFYVCAVGGTQDADGDLENPVLWKETNGCDGLQRSGAIYDCPNGAKEYYPADTNCSAEPMACVPLAGHVDAPRAGPVLP